jgi:hypothetical protein
MLGKLREKWRQLQRGQPGRRFQDRYERSRHTRHNKPWYLRFLKITLALVLILIGLALTILPGPAVVFFALGAALLANQSRPLARLLDWTEVKARQVLAAVRNWWPRASVLARGGVVMLGTLGTTGVGYVFYRVMFRE